jgi:hypothetical protein
MEELSVKPSISVVSGDVFKELGMMDKVQGTSKESV